MATQSLQSIITASLNKGDKGDVGSKGDKGAQPASAAYASANDTVTFTNSDSSTFDFTGIKGQKGITGDKGDIGDKGSAGDLSAVSGIAESFTTLTSATGTVVHDVSLGTVFYHTGIAANFTANFTNVPTTDSRARVVVLILSQGSTAYMPTSVQIDGTSQTIKWAGGIAAAGTASGVNTISFTLIRAAGTWTVTAQTSSFS